MSEVFVIKNKEGEYWCGNDVFSAVIDIKKIYICEDFDFISKVINKLSNENLLKDCKVVPITIAEGDLLHKIRELKDYIYSYNDETNNRPQICNEYIDVTCKDILEKIKELKL